MTEKRPSIPSHLDRAVKRETGYACAMHDCTWPLLDRCHIIDWAQSQDHCFANLIAFCPNHHRLHTCGELDDVAVRVVKAELAIRRDRYNDHEVLWLDRFTFPEYNHTWRFNEEAKVRGCLRQLVEDGYLAEEPGSEFTNPDGKVLIIYRWTRYGVLFVKAWAEAHAHRSNKVMSEVTTS